MRLRVGEGQRRAPGATKQLPALDVEMKAQPLHVGHQIPGGVALEAGVWPRTAAAALVEQDDAIAAGIMITTHAGVAAATGTAMHDQHRLAARIAAFLEKNLVLVANFQMLLAIGLDGNVKTEPLTCRHPTGFLSLLLPSRCRNQCTTQGYSGKACSRPNASAMHSGGAAVLQTQQAQFA